MLRIRLGMTEDTMAFLDAMQKRGGGDFLKELAEAVLQRLMDYDVEGRIGAGRYERSDERLTQRNGFRERSYDTRLGTLELKIPKLRKGSYFPAFLEPRNTAEAGRRSRPFRRRPGIANRLDCLHNRTGKTERGFARPLLCAGS